MVDVLGGNVFAIRSLRVNDKKMGFYIWNVLTSKFETMV